MNPSVNKADPALHAALKRKMNFDDGGMVGSDDDSNANAGVPIPTKASAAADTLQSLAATPASSSPSSSGGGAGASMPGQNQFGKMPDANPPNFPKINVVSNAYNPAMRGLPTPQSRQQAAAAALQPVLNALAQLKVKSQ